MKKTAIIAASILMGLIIIGLIVGTSEDTTFPSDDENAVQEAPEAPIAPAAPEPAPEAPVESMEDRGAALGLGDDPRFNRLAGRCDAGEQDACDTLYWESPVDSDYEAWALERFGYDDVIDDLDPSSDTLVNDVLELLWEQIPADQQREMCIGYALSPNEMAEALSDGADGTITVPQALEFIEGVCG